MSDKKVPRIKIGADYFRTTVRKESSYNLSWRWTKETLQNAIDAGATDVIFNIYKDGNYIEVIDNGSGMDEDTLLDVFLSFGGTKKDSEHDNIGGFGDAKKVICFCWDEWEIHTRDNYLNNELLDVKLRKVDVLEGTRIKAKLGEHLSVDKVIEYLSLCQLKDTDVTVNLINEEGSSEELEYDELQKKKLTRSIDFADMYVNKSNKSELLVVRINGLALFTKRMWDVPATVVLELKGLKDPKDDAYILNVTRESLVYEKQMVIDKLLNEIISSPNKMLKEESENKINVIKGSGAISSLKKDVSVEEMTFDIESILEMKNLNSDERFDKYKGMGVNFKLESTKSKMITSYLENVSPEDLIGILKKSKKESNFLNSDLTSSVSFDKIAYGVEIDNKLKKVFPYDIIVVGETKLRYDGIKYQKIILAWHKIIQYVMYYNLINDNLISIDEYNIGFTFDEDEKACYIYKDGMNMFLVNPSDISFQDYGWRGVTCELLDRACHELAHVNCPYHDGKHIALYHQYKSVCNWYMDDIFNGIGAIIRSKENDLLSSANLDEKFDLSFDWL